VQPMDVAWFSSHSAHDPMPQLHIARTMRQAEDPGDSYRMRAMRSHMNVRWRGTCPSSPMSLFVESKNMLKQM
jgi:hypothetical protein